MEKEKVFKPLEQGYPNVRGVRELNNWRRSGIRVKDGKLCTDTNVSFNVNHVVSCESAPKSITDPLSLLKYIIKLSDGDVLAVSESTAWEIMEGESWIENHRLDLGEKVYKRLVEDRKLLRQWRKERDDYINTTK